LACPLVGHKENAYPCAARERRRFGTDYFMLGRSWKGSVSRLRSHARPAHSARSISRAVQLYGGRLLTGPLIWWLILWAAWAVRLWQLDASDLTYDEAATYYVAYRPLPDILAYLQGAVREHPPVYYLLMRFWMSLAGTSEYSLRFFAVGASLIGIALTARLARRLARQLGVSGRLELLIATSLPALFLALFPFEVYYARDARMYTLILVWATLSSLLFWPLLVHREAGEDEPRRQWPNPWALAGLVLVNGLALFTHYYLVLFIATQFVSLLFLRRWRALLAWSSAHGMVGLIGVVWLLRSPGLKASLQEAWGRFVPLWPTVGQLRRLLAELLFGPVRGVPWNLIYGWGALVALGLLVAWLRSFRAGQKIVDAPVGRPPRRPGLQAVGPWLTISILLPVALGFLMPEPPLPRYLIFILPFVALTLGQLPFVLSGQKKVLLLGLGVAALATWSLGVFGLPRTVKWIKSSYGHTVAAVSAHARPGDGVLWYGPWQWAQFHYYRPDNFPPITRVPQSAPPQLVPEEAEPVLEELLSTYQRLWVIPAAVDDVDPAHFVAGWLNIHAHPVWTRHDLSLYLPPLAYAQDAAQSPEQEGFSIPLGLIFDQRLHLKRVAGDAAEVPAGEGLRLTLTWTVSDTLAGDVKLDLSLLDERSNRWLQWQIVPHEWANPPSTWKAGEVITDRQGLIVPQGAPPGRYTVQLTVVDVGSGVPLQPTGTAGPPAQMHVDLFAFQVVEPVAPPVLTDVGDFRGPFTFESPARAADALALAGYELGGLKFQQGNPIPLRLHWLAPTEPVSNLTLRLQLLERGPATAIVTETLALAPSYPVSEWSAGRVVAVPTALSIPVDAPPGSAELTLAVLGPDGRPWSINGGQQLTMGTLTVEERPMLRRLPSGLTSLRVDFVDATGNTDDRIALRGYRVEGEARPGGRLELTYAWQALSQPRRIYSVFNHLLTADGQHLTQADGWPQGGVVLTNQWRPGEYIEDSHTIEIPADAPAGPYLLAVGLYDAATEERLSAFQEGHPLPVDQLLVAIEGSQEAQP
jgi:hypothetical protein